MYCKYSLEFSAPLPPLRKKKTSLEFEGSDPAIPQNIKYMSSPSLVKQKDNFKGYKIVYCYQSNSFIEPVFKESLKT